ncbi:MAG: acyclic terpene utilization AtuA family protein [Planctomycetaceae bacterium]
MKTIRIGNGAAFWGDNLDAPRLLCEGGGGGGRLDYLTLEYLAELTMSILAHQKSRDPTAGYVSDFPTVVESLIPLLKAQPALRIVTNAGGMNPSGCAHQVATLLQKHGLGKLSLAAVDGDDLLPDLDKHLAAGETFSHFDTGQSIDDVRERIVSANAYLGAKGIVDALADGARIVMTGRVADASLTVGPCMHEFGWPWTDCQRLAAATVAGHIIECGAQATGGIYSDWTESLDLADVGYPIAEISDDGSLVITKPPGTGGTVTVGTVSEQIVYEIGDPVHYLTPDIDADFSQLRLEQEGQDRVRITGARGNAAPASYKVSLAYHDGYLVSGTLVIAGRDAVAKAKAAAEMIFARVRRAGFNLARTNVEFLGAGDSVPGVWPSDSQPWEVVLRVSAHDPSRDAVERLARELAPLVCNGPPGVTGYTGARPQPHRVLDYWPTTIDRSRISPKVTVRTAAEWIR